MLFDPNGQLVAESRSKDVADEMVVVPLNGELVADRRSQSCFNLQTRKPEVFAALTRPTE